MYINTIEIYVGYTQDIREIYRDVRVGDMCVYIDLDQRCRLIYMYTYVQGQLQRGIWYDQT